MAWIARQFPKCIPGLRRRLAYLVLTGLVFGAVSAPALAINDLSGQPVPNTSPGGQLDATGPVTRLGTPFLDPRPGHIGADGSPEEDLHEALRTIATTADVGVANQARRRAIDILEGTTSGAAYDGIPLLNFITPGSKTKNVPAGGTVTVRLVRFGEHQISDTWLLNFANQNLPFRITYEITEFGGAEGGDLTPTPLLHDGGTSIGGLHSVVTPLTRDESPLDTFQDSRFTNAMGFGQRSEHTRLATQRFTVRMPPPKNLSVVLDPNLRPDHEALSALRSSAGPTTNVTQATLGSLAPEMIIRTELGNADFPDVATANARGSAALPQVATMRVKSHLPPGVGCVPNGADLTAVFLNNEVYVSRTSLRVPPNEGQAVRVTVCNRDGFTHTVSGIELENLVPVLGATNWGQFRWDPLGGTTDLPAGTDATLTFQFSSSSFALVVGDPNSGDQARAQIALDRGPDQQSFTVPGPAFAFPLHGAIDVQGNVWVTLAGVDKIARLTPAGNLAASGYAEFHLPPPPPFAVAWEPVDIHVDAAGVVWATLAAGNAIMRLDPAQAQANTSNGIEVLPLAACPESECRPPPPPEPVALSREPTQMTVKNTPTGTEVWFTEALADSIGVVKWLGPGNFRQQHFPCACKVPPLAGGAPAAGNPSGIDVDPSGNIWFAGANKNTIVRLIPPADPFATSIATTQHFAIPSGAQVNEPEIGGEFFTSIPHSVAVDHAGRVWFTELGMHRVGYLEPWRGVPGTPEGMREFDIAKNDFGAFNQPADIAVDPAGTVYTADEYGDEINALTRCGPKTSWRPTERLSFTDQPMIDAQGNLWFLEAGANMITRIAGVAARPGAPDSGAGCDLFGPPPPTSTATGSGSSAAPVDPVAVACAKRHWAFGTRKAPRVLLLGNTPAQVTRCLGRPTSKKGTLWRYGSRLTVRFTKGKVTSFVVLNKAFRSSVGSIGVGSPVTALRRLSTAKVTQDRSRIAYTTVLRIGPRIGAQIRYTVVKNKVTRITVTQVKVKR